jgi:hypothetical protein
MGFLCEVESVHIFFEGGFQKITQKLTPILFVASEFLPKRDQQRLEMLLEDVPSNERT